MKRKDQSKEIIERINNIGLTVPPEQLSAAIMERVNSIDQQIAGVLLMIVEFDSPEEPVHETGIPVTETLDLLEARRNRLLSYIKEDLGEGPEDTQATQVMPVIDLEK